MFSLSLVSMRPNKKAVRSPSFPPRTLCFLRFQESPCPDPLQILARCQQTAARGAKHDPF
jgi:hypothetical protein